MKNAFDTGELDSPKTADLEHSNGTNIISVNDAKNLGFLIGAGKAGEKDPEYADKVTNANKVRI